MFKDRFHRPEYEYDERVFVDYVNRQYTDGLASIKKKMDAIIPPKLSREAEILAGDTLNKYWDSEYPVDSCRIAHGMGIAVHIGDTPGGATGLILKKAGSEKPIISVKGDVSTSRQRIAFAYAAGYYIGCVNGAGGTEYDPEESFGLRYYSIDSDEFILRDRISSGLELPGRNTLEIFADRFALSLLMPRHELKSFSDAGVNTLMTAWAFDVSETALLNRLHWLESDSLTTNRQPSELFRNLLR